MADGLKVLDTVRWVTLVGMNEADVIALEILRKVAGDDVPSELWAAVEKQVAEVGILGLTGTARLLVEGVVRKHGGSSHNQKDHGRGGGGGGGSNAGGGKAGGGGGGQVGIEGTPGKPMKLEDAAGRMNSLVRNRMVTAENALEADMREATVNSPNLPKGTKARVLAVNVDRGEGREKLAYVAFEKPTKYENGPYKADLDVVEVPMSEISMED